MVEVFEDPTVAGTDFIPGDVTGIGQVPSLLGVYILVSETGNT